MREPEPELEGETAVQSCQACLTVAVFALQRTVEPECTLHE